MVTSQQHCNDVMVTSCPQKASALLRVPRAATLGEQSYVSRDKMTSRWHHDDVTGYHGDVAMTSEAPQQSRSSTTTALFEQPHTGTVL